MPSSPTRPDHGRDETASGAAKYPTAIEPSAEALEMAGDVLDAYIALHETEFPDDGNLARGVLDVMVGHALDVFGKRQRQRGAREAIKRFVDVCEFREGGDPNGTLIECRICGKSPPYDHMEWCPCNAAAIRDHFEIET